MARDSAPVRIPLEELPLEVRPRFRLLAEKPTLAVRGSVEVFRCQPGTYSWLLDHPDQASRLWHLMGVKVTDIHERGPGAFSWQDGQGSRMQWETVLATAQRRIWLAEGQVKPGVLLPAVSVQAAVIVSHTAGTEGSGRPAVRHQVELVLHLDSHAIALATRVMGGSAPAMAQQYVGQVAMFFGGLAWYLEMHPEHARALLAQLQRPSATDAVIPPPAERAKEE
jgi:hypothetical protein